MNNLNTAPAQTGRTTIELVHTAADAIVRKKGLDVVAYDVSAVSSVTDYYLVASGLNAPHINALFTEIRFALKAEGVNCWRLSGNQESGWMVADYIDFIIHFFKKDVRTYYDIDRLWQNAPKIDLNL